MLLQTLSGCIRHAYIGHIVAEAVKRRSVVEDSVTDILTQVVAVADGESVDLSSVESKK